MEEYFSIQSRMAEAVDMTFIRSVYEKIQWNSRLIGILGARGTGKSTLVLQYFKSQFNDPEKCLYISADNPIVLGRGVFSIVSEFFKMYGNTVIIDEVHKQKNWVWKLRLFMIHFPGNRSLYWEVQPRPYFMKKGICPEG